MYKTAKEFVESEIPVKVRIKLCPIFQAGIKAYNDIIGSDYKLFRSDYSSNIYGHLKTFVIYRQFEKDMLSKEFPFKCNAQVVNNFKYKVPKLTRKNGVFIVCRSKRTGELPSQSDYKKEYCKNNNFESRQLKMNLGVENNSIVTEEKFLGFITYGIKDKKLNFVNLVVPDKEMGECLYTVDLKYEFDMYLRNNKIDSEEQESIVATLKEEWLKKTK